LNRQLILLKVIDIVHGALAIPTPAPSV